MTKEMKNQKMLIREIYILMLNVTQILNGRDGPGTWTRLSDSGRRYMSYNEYRLESDEEHIRNDEDIIHDFIESLVEVKRNHENPVKGDDEMSTETNNFHSDEEKKGLVIDLSNTPNYMVAVGDDDARGWSEVHNATLRWTMEKIHSLFDLWRIGETFHDILVEKQKEQLKRIENLENELEIIRRKL